MAVQTKASQPKTEAVSKAEYDRIVRETAERDAREPRVESAVYDAEIGRLIVTLKGGATLSTSAAGLPGLGDASNEELAHVVPMSGGASLHWPALDVQYTTIAFLETVLPIRTVQSQARRAGATRTVAKSAASRANGRKGGRPVKAPVVA